MKIVIKNYLMLYLLIIFSFLIRIVVVYHYGDIRLENEWGILVNNLYNHGKLSLYSFDGNFIPSTLMPPLYVFFIFLIKIIIPENIDLVKSVLNAQVIISTFSIFLFYKLNNFFFTKKWSIFNSFLLSIFPLNIYTSSQISSITLQVFLSILFLYLLFDLCMQKKFEFFKILYFSITAGFLMLLRGEFYLIYIASLFYLFIIKKINFKKLSIIFLISLLFISPYLARNYLIFNKIVLTNSVGYNLWKGNNPFSTVEGSEMVSSREYKQYFKNKILKETNDLPKNNFYEFHYNDFFLEQGLIHIKEKPFLFLERFVKKTVVFFYFNIDSDYPNYYHPLFIIPTLLISFLSSIGIIVSIKKLNFEKKYLLLYMLFTICIFSLFFILPRYKMIILPIQLIFMNYFFIEFFKRKIN